MFVSLTNNKFLLKTLSLFSLVRGYNIVFIIFAQFVSSIFIFSEHFEEIVEDLVRTFQEFFVQFSVWATFLSFGGTFVGLLSFDGRFNHFLVLRLSLLSTVFGFLLFGLSLKFGLSLGVCLSLGLCL